MPSGQYIRTPEIREKNKKAMLANPQRYWLGKKMSIESRKKLSESCKGRIVSEETRKKIGLKSKGNKYGLGSKRSEEIKRKMSEDRKGRKAWNKGLKGLFHHTKEHREKMSKLMSGEKSPFWKGGITPINKLIRESMEYRLWREAVFKRDNYTCVWCGIKFIVGVTGRVVLQADHIKPFAYFPELRFAIDNGRTLCEPCHKKTKTWGGLTKFKSKKNNYGNKRKTIS